jgi:hypothetical protein
MAVGQVTTRWLHLGTGEDRWSSALGAVINSREHDQRADRRQAEGDRQQHRNCRDSPYARKNADQCADERAEQTKTDVVWMGGNRETERKVGEKFTHNGCSVPGPKLKRQLQQIDE